MDRKKSRRERVKLCLELSRDESRFLLQVNKAVFFAKLFSEESVSQSGIMLRNLLATAYKKRLCSFSTPAIIPANKE